MDAMPLDEWERWFAEEYAGMTVAELHARGLSGHPCPRERETCKQGKCPGWHIGRHANPAEYDNPLAQARRE